MLISHVKIAQGVYLNASSIELCISVLTIDWDETKLCICIDLNQI